jgi:hypothetical protein
VPWIVLGCEAVDAPELGECGNGIVEPDAGEDCEPVGDPQRCGAAGTGARACRFVCDVGDCPEGYRCGLDEICRMPCVGHEGEPACSPFEPLSTDVSASAIADVAVMDVGGDERREIVAVEYEGDESFAALVRIYAREGDAFVPGATAASTGDFPLITRLDPGGPMFLFAQRTSLPAPPAASGAEHRQAVVSVVDAELGFREVLMQGPTAVDPGPLALASVSLPADVPDGGVALLFGYRDRAVWRPEPTPFEVVASGHPEDLVGPTFGQPIAAAAAVDALASRHCAVMVHGYEGSSQLHAINPCEGLADGWTSVQLALPELPGELGEGLVLADTNGDALADLVVTTAAGRIHVAYAVGDGSFHSDATALPAAGGDGGFDAGVGGAVHSLGVIGAGDFDGDGRPDFVTRSTWIRSCAIEGCGTCDVPGYRCDGAPIFRATAASVVDRDGDGDLELAVIADGAQGWEPVEPAAGDLVIVERPATSAWTARVIDLPGGAELLDSGDLDGDGRAEIVLMRAREEGDELVVVFGSDDTVERVADFERIVDAHVVRGTQTVAVVSEELDGSHRRLSVLTATLDHALRSTAKLELQVVPRQFVGGRFDPAGARGIAVVGEGSGSDIEVELLTRGDGSFFDGSSRRSAVTALGLSVEHAGRMRGIAVDLDGDDLDELVVFAPDGFVRTLRVGDRDGMPAFDDTVRRDTVAEPYGGPVWPGHADPFSIGSSPARRDLDADGDDDLWLLTGEDPPRIAAFRNLGDGTLDVQGRALTPHPDVELSICEAPPEECRVRISAFAPFEGSSDRTRSISPSAADLVLLSHRALFVRTLDPFDPPSALPLQEVAVVHGMRQPVGPPGTQVVVALADIDGDGVDDVLAGGASGLRFLRGLALNP